MVSTPRAPRPTRARSRTSGFSSRVARSTSPVPVTSSRPAICADSAGGDTAGAVGAGRDRRRPGSARRCRPCCAGDSPRCSELGVEHRAAGCRRARSPSSPRGRRRRSRSGRSGVSIVCSGARDRGEAVAGADHLHGRAVGPRLLDRRRRSPRCRRVPRPGWVGRLEARPVAPLHAGEPRRGPSRAPRPAPSGWRGRVCATRAATSAGADGDQVRRRRAVVVDDAAGRAWRPARHRRRARSG